MDEFGRPIIESSFIGYNDHDPSHLLARGVFSKADNAYLSSESITKVPGSSTVAGAIATKTINGLASYEKISASVKYLIVNIDGASNAQLYRWSGSGSFAGIGSANLTNAKTMYFAVAGDYLFGFNGAESVDYDGTTVTKNRAYGIGDVNSGYFPAWFHNYLFVARTDTYPNRLFWSNLGTPTVFGASNYVDINPGDSDQCMGLGLLQDEMFYFKRNSIWSITGWSGSSFTSTTIATQNTNARIMGYGCVAPESIVSTGNDIYFLSFLGSAPVIRSLRKTQYATTLGGGVISNDISGTMDTINQSVMSKATATFDGQYIYFAVPTGSSTVNNLILVLNTWDIVKVRGKTMYPWTTMSTKPAGHLVLSSISGKAIPYFADSGATGLVFKFDTSVFTDNGSPVILDVRTRDFWQNLSRKSKWVYGYFRYKSGSAGTLQIKAKIDQGADYTLQKSINLQGNSPGLGPTGTFTLGVSVLGGATISRTRISFIRMTGGLFNLQFYEATANSCRIYDFELYGLPKGLRSS